MIANLIELIFINFGVTIIVLALLININEEHLPKIIVQTFRYGKHAYKGAPSQLIASCEIPKGYFKHFYVFAIVWAGLISSLGAAVYCAHVQLPEWILSGLDLLCGSERHAKSRSFTLFSSNEIHQLPLSHSATELSTFLAIGLLTLQCIRRFYETQFVQIFSNSSKMNLTHYVVGYFHYFGAFLLVLAQAPGFTRDSVPLKPLLLTDLTIHHVASIGLFLYAWYHQFQSNLILSNLRRNKTGTIVTQKHLLPTGGYFEYLSAPHMFFEIVMYVALYILLFGNTSFVYVLLWVLTNQIENSWLCHKWYLETFKDYPEQRKAIIPLVF